MDIVNLASRILAYGDTCDNCLGRFFGKLSFGLSNRERGHALRTAVFLAENRPSTPPANCWICGGLFSNLEEWADKVISALRGIEFETFAIGTKVPPLIAESEEVVWSDLGLSHAEPFKSELNREVGKIVARKSGKTADPTHPDVVAILDISAGSVELQINPVFFCGRYCKLERGIPQTHWDCRACRGKGCEKCGYTGKQYPDSVEELIGRPAIRLFSAGKSILHGSGREDIDALMTGTGRPFVMEVVAPRTRSVDLKDLEAAINREAAGRVTVVLDRYGVREDVEIIKSARGDKRYRILVEIEGPCTQDELQSAIGALKGVKVYQRTPLRVVHRRADRVRERRVIDIRFLGEEDGRAVLEVTGEAGLYIKELISGDQGRTEPSLSGILGRPARVSRLDVIHVSADNEGE
ncbi:MAG: tRNA pseudouridine(54/55) synthase Pus10 [Methanolinea sp.]|nr:tRNA pseudouridine(54/55) synthase Pus10 [Methanolinea sp.]